VFIKFYKKIILDIFLTTLYFLNPIYNIHELLTIAILIKTNVTLGLINESPAPAITKIKNPKDKNKKFRLIIPVD
jgi:hypothetical protein